MKWLQSVASSSLQLWILPAFGCRPQYDNGLEQETFGFAIWTTVLNFAIPLNLFYRMHCVASLFEVFRKVWGKILQDGIFHLLRRGSVYQVLVLQIRMSCVLEVNIPGARHHIIQLNFNLKICTVLLNLHVECIHLNKEMNSLDMSHVSSLQ